VTKRKAFLPKLLVAQITWFGVIAWPNVAVAQADSIAQTVTSLRAIKADVYKPLPAAARPLLTHLKHQLRDLILLTLNAQGMRQPSSSHLRASILAQLKRAGVQIEDAEEAIINNNGLKQEYVYGDIYEITILRPARHPDLIAATTTIGICCGQDTSLYLFKKQDAKWRLALTQETNDYEEISGAQAWFQYALSPPDARGDFFLVTANVNPWCTSNWQSLRYQVMRLGPGAEQPRVILKREATIYLGVAPPIYRLKVEARRFSLKFYTEASPKAIERGLTSQRAVLWYSVAGDRVRRIPATARARVK
jgi:hypothetical protein